MDLFQDLSTIEFAGMVITAIALMLGIVVS